MKDKIKEVHPFPYIDKCLPFTDWNDQMWNTNSFNPSISQDVKKHYEGELKKLEEKQIIVKPTEQGILWARQHAQWLYSKSKIHYPTDMMQTLLRIQSMMTCLRLSQDGKIQSIEGIICKASKSEDTKGKSDEEEQLPAHEEYDAPLIDTKKIDTSKLTTRSDTCL